MGSLTTIEIVLLLLCIIAAFTLIIFIIRTKDSGYNYNFNKIIEELNEQQKKNLEDLNAGNKEIDRIESEILKYKKKLGMKLFKD